MNRKRPRKAFPRNSTSRSFNHTIFYLAPIFIIVAFFIIFDHLSAQERFEGKRSLIFLKKNSDYKAAQSFIESSGGHILHLFPPRILIGYLTETADSVYKSSPFIDTVLTGYAEPRRLDELSSTEKMGLNRWNDLFVNTVEMERTDIEYPLPTNLFSNNARFTDDGNSPFVYNEHPMIGAVSVGIVFVESDGSIDSDQESWTDESMNEMIKGISEGLEWWSLAGGYRANLSWTYDIRICRTSFEPIQRPKNESSLWINDCMEKLGYFVGSDFERTDAYADFLKRRYSTDHSFIIFAVSSKNDSDGYFAEKSGVAWAYVGGPYMVIPEKSSNWGASGTWKVAAHEVGHIFNASDEYDSEINETSLLASNTDHPSKKFTTNTDLCMMKTNDPILCELTRKQIGWVDRNRDGVFDQISSDNSELFHLQKRKKEAEITAYNKLLFHENFSRKNDWYEDKNNRIINGTYRMYDSAYGNASWLERSYDDFIASVKTQWIQGSSANGYGLMVRAKTADDGYIFFINKHAQFAFGKYVNAEWKYLIPWAGSGSIRTNDANVLRITCVENRFILFVNDQKVGDIKDDTFMYGYIGLTVLPDVQAAFDDLIVYSP